jgi:hypothetical protein
MGDGLYLVSLELLVLRSVAIAWSLSACLRIACNDGISNRLPDRFRLPLLNN